MSVCVQHELDHLDGIVFIDHLSQLKKSRAVTKLAKRRKEKADVYKRQVSLSKRRREATSPMMSAQALRPASKIRSASPYASRSRCKRAGPISPAFIINISQRPVSYTHLDVYKRQDQGIIDANEQAVIENVFNMENRPVTTAMTARESIVYFTLDESEAEIRKQISQNPHNYFLVCDGDIDHVIGFIDSKNVLRRLLEGKPISITCLLYTSGKRLIRRLCRP